MYLEGKPIDEIRRHAMVTIGTSGLQGNDMQAIKDATYDRLNTLSSYANLDARNKGV
jgi:hypothetical protein